APQFTSAFIRAADMKISWPESWRPSKGAADDVGELVPGRDTQLRIRTVEMEGDRAWAEEQLGRDVPVAQPARSEPYDLQLLWRQTGERVVLAALGRLALTTGTEPRGGAFGPRRGTEPLEDVQGRP